MKHKIVDLEGALLDAAVLLALDSGQTEIPPYNRGPNYKPSSKWEQGGVIIQRARISLDLDPNGPGWTAILRPRHDPGEIEEGDWIEGRTPLIAAMRAYVASKFGGEVELP